MQDSKRAEKGTGSGYGWVFVCLGSMFVGGVTVTASQGMNMVMLVLKGMYMAFVGERVSESGQKEEGNCDGRDVESRLFFCDLAYKSSEVCVIEFFIELSFSLAVTR